MLASYHFPPDDAVGAVRAAKYAHRLPDFGCEVHVLTARDHLRNQGFDTSRLAGLEHVSIVRTGEPPRVVEALIHLKGKLQGKLSSRSRQDVPGSGVAAHGPAPEAAAA